MSLYTERDAGVMADAGERTMILFMGGVSEEALDIMRRVAPYDDGELVDGLMIEDRGETEQAIVGLAKHTEGVLKGTGLYGPKKERIKPRTAQALKFEWDAIGGRTAIFKGDLTTPQEKASFAAWAEARGMVPFFVWPAGMRPRNFAADTLDELTPRIPALMGEAARITRGSFG